MIYIYIFMLMIFSWGVFFLVKYIPDKYLWMIMWVMVALMVVISATKPDTSSDYWNYVDMFNNYDDAKNEMITEPTYRFISWLIHELQGGFDYVLWIYALLSIPLKVYSFKRLSSFENLFLALPIYFAFFYQLHDCEQIRLAAAMSFMMFAYVCRVEKRPWFTWICLWLISVTFHYTTVVAIVPLLLYSSKPFTWKYKTFLTCLIFLGVIIWVLKINIITLLPIPAIETKMALYEVSIAKGDQLETIPLTYPVALLRYATFFYILYFYDTVRQYVKGLNIILLVDALGLFAWGGLSATAIFAVRFSELFQIPELILFASVFYTVRPKWIGQVYTIAAAIYIYLYGIIMINQFGYI